MQSDEPNGKLESFQFELGDLKPDEVEFMYSIVVFATVI